LLEEVKKVNSRFLSSHGKTLLSKNCLIDHFNFYFYKRKHKTQVKVKKKKG